MLGYALSTKGYRIWLIEEKKVVETINVRFDEGKGGVVSEKTFTGPVRNYLFKDFPEDGDIFSAVGTHTLRPCASIPWIRKPVERKDRSRTDIYYFVEGSNVRLRLFNEVQKYCKDNNIDYHQNLFNYSSKNSSSGKVADLLNPPLEEKANLIELDVNNAYIYARFDEVIYMQQPEGYVNEANKVCKLNKALYGLHQSGRQCIAFIEVRLDDGVTFPAGWCVNRVWVPWMSTSSPRYRLGGSENVICKSAHLRDSGTGSISF
ncbi:hypothetical protein TNCV_2768151 [Trichonephila clavipes]|nr:hypothetical protein TNCV_2768151 [Trichonephila clavipes]